MDMFAAIYVLDARVDLETAGIRSGHAIDRATEHEQQ